MKITIFTCPHNSLIFRKFLAALVLALHVTPGRRFRATMLKFEQCSKVLNPPCGLVKALLDLLEDRGWSNSIEDLGVVVGAPKDNEEGFLKTTTDTLLRAIVDKLAQCRDFKVKDMSTRYEIILEAKTSVSGAKCCHSLSSVNSERVVALFVSGFLDETLTFGHFQEDLDRMMSSTNKEDCQTCGKLLVKTVKRKSKEFCDPDFLTVAFDKPVCFKGRRAIIFFGASLYELKVVIHWDGGCASVSKKMKEIWHWHGVDVSQLPDFDYNAAQMRSSAHLKNVVVMMLVRRGGRDDLQVQPCESSAISNQNKEMSGSKRGDKDETAVDAEKREKRPWEPSCQDIQHGDVPRWDDGSGRREKTESEGDYCLSRSSISS